MSTQALHILGTAITDFGELWQLSLTELFCQAATQAITDAGLEPDQIEAVYVANKAGGNFQGQAHLNALVSASLPHCPPAVRIEAACASGGAALLTAADALRAGRYQTVLVVGFEKMTDVSGAETTAILSTAADAERQAGSTFPALYALLANAYLRQHPTVGDSGELLAQVAVKNHHHALDNPHAQFHKTLTVADVMRSPLVATPLRVLDCSPISDGAAAVVLSRRRGRSKAKLIGSGHGQDRVVLADRTSLTQFAATQRAATQAYTTAGLEPSAIQLAEVHDCFTIAELLAVADLGFLPADQVPEAYRRGRFYQGQSLVINRSGGLKAGGHPVGATGVKQVAYLAEQLAAGAGRYALAHNIGGAGATAVVHILEATHV